MNQDIIKRYGIDFKNRVNLYKEIDKFPNCKHQELTFFLYDLNLSEIDKVILPDIHAVLSEQEVEAESGNDAVFLTIDKNEVVFYMNNKSPLSIPTLDFKQIVEGWKAFLLSPPLNRSKQ